MRLVIAGAGLAGLSAACDLAGAGHEVTLCERRPWAGGKTYSFTDRDTGEQVDNGQHIAMRCTTEYVRFLERIGSAQLMRWQPRMSVPVFDAAGRRSVLRADPLPAPLHMLPSFVAYRHLSSAGKLRVARGIIAVRRAVPADLGEVTFASWLRAQGQTSRTIGAFWDLIIVPALNATCADVSAEQALFVFQTGFLASATLAAIGVPRAGLTQLHVEPALRYVRDRGGALLIGATVERVELNDGAVRAVLIASGERIPCDACVVAVPPRDALALLPADAGFVQVRAALAAMRMSPIVNLHLWFDRAVADFAFAAFTGGDLQWVFNHGRIRGSDAAGTEHLVVSLSAAARYMPLDKGELLTLLLPQLRRALPRAADATLLRSVLIKEPDATFVPARGLVRPGARTPARGLYIAGAYTDTGWPATMESAVRSGIVAARAIAHDASALRAETREAAPAA